MNKVNFRSYDVIKSPVVTEKSQINTQYAQYTFDVDRTATKPEIKEAVEAIFEVKVKAVNTLVRKGKNKVFRGVSGRQQDRKKAVVTLQAGQNIELNGGV